MHVSRADPDQDCVRRVQAGDREAFRTLICAHQPVVLAYGLRALGDEARAQDLAQEVFLTFWRERDRYEHRGRLRAYLLRIARHRALASHKKRQGHLRLLEAVGRSPTPARATPLEEVQRRALRARLEAALERLPDDRAQAVRLRCVLGLSVAETAQALDVPEGTVKSRVARGLAALKEALSDVD